MTKELNQVKEFHEIFGQPVLNIPTIPSIERCKLRYELILEELKELKEAYENNDLIEVADALTDIRYVLNGAYLEFGLGYISEVLFDEVQRSNLSKACLSIEEAKATIQYYLEKDGTESEYKEKDGKYLVYRKVDGKVLKSINYSPADLKTILEGESYFLFSDMSKTTPKIDTLPIMSDEEAEKEFAPFKVKNSDKFSLDISNISIDVFEILQETIKSSGLQGSVKILNTETGEDITDTKFTK